MALPTPPFSLDDACTVIYNNTLFSYSSDGHLQSLDLQPGAEWSELPKGVPVTGACCVRATSQNASAALWVVGGTATDANYPGLQRFTFADGKWDTITLSQLVTKDRLYHNAVYLNVSDSILVYAGTQDGSEQLSSQTFTIQASEPFGVLAYQTQVPPPPAISPLLMPWTDNQAVMIYGSRAMVFDPNPALSWFDSGASLTDPIYNTSTIKALLMLGDDGSKSLYTFDMSVAPNQVNRTILVDNNSDPIKNATIVSRGLELSEKRELVDRATGLTLATWPAYNGTLASSTTRNSYSITDDGNGLVVFSGGNDQDPLCMFQAKENSWLNTTQALVLPGEQNQVSTTTTSVASTASSTVSSTTLSTPLSTTSPSPTATNSGTINAGVAPAFPVKILVAVLGSIIGAALIIIVILLLLRCRRKRQEGNGSDNGSDASSQFNKKYRAEISNPIPQRQPYRNFQQPTVNGRGPSTADERGSSTRPRASRGGRGGSARRSSGWDRYWSGGSAMNILGFGSKRTTYEDSAGDSESFYSEQRLPSQVPSQATQPSAVVPPLKLGHPELNKVASGSPTIAHTSSQYPLTREMSGQIERPHSLNSESDYEDDDRRDAFSSGVPASVHETTSWGPIDGRDWRGNYTKETQFPPPHTDRHTAQHSSDMSWLNLGGDSRV
ncbi:hypothetical protein OIDMADRAFT_159472 [Oidiodendron maius Zn]|uniref:Pre-mRNA splicing factor CLF1 n=1 Tax=Oidiodendron maius (strain Zn) TaxID=913774 RepID=A0A0C3HPI5_OIDMZ|nr:hypothetical protein OIDMADRAFT_159472 [Oidiodendron maius Zn]